MSLFKEFLTFSKKDRMGIIALLIVMLISISSFILIDFIPANHPPTDFSEFKKQIDEFESQRDHGQPHFYSHKEKAKYTPSQKNYFPFDPNTISKDSLKLLGIYDNISERIIKYRTAGGKFSQSEDLLKIYGFSQKLYTKLQPFIKIKSEGGAKIPSEMEAEKPVKNNSLARINLNTADTTELKSLKGIGSKLSARIVKFRTNAGGFYSIEQLTDVYGVKPELLEQLRSQLTTDDHFKKININTCTAEELKNHPYIYKWNIANAIVNYRSKHGNYKQAADLIKTDLVSEELSRKIAPYLIFE